MALLALALGVVGCSGTPRDPLDLSWTGDLDSVDYADEVEACGEGAVDRLDRRGAVVRIFDATGAPAEVEIEDPGRVPEADETWGTCVELGDEELVLVQLTTSRGSASPGPKVYGAIDADGRVLWTERTDDEVHEVDRETLVLDDGSENPRTRTYVDVRTGRTVLRDTPDALAVVYADGTAVRRVGARLVLQDARGRVVRRLDGRVPRGAAVEPVDGGLAVLTAGRAALVDLDSGRFRWETDLTGHLDLPDDLEVEGGVVARTQYDAPGGVLVIGGSDGVVAIDVRTGEVLWDERIFGDLEGLAEDTAYLSVEDAGLGRVLLHGDVSARRVPTILLDSRTGEQVPTGGRVVSGIATAGLVVVRDHDDLALVAPDELP